mgnify:CR=1 FL=1
MNPVSKMQMGWMDGGTYNLKRAILVINEEMPNATDEELVTEVAKFILVGNYPEPGETKEERLARYLAFVLIRGNW